MIAYLKGELVVKSEEYIIIEVQGIVLINFGRAKIWQIYH